MSGGAYNYGYSRVDQLADDIESEFVNDGKYMGEDWSSGKKVELDRIGDATKEQRPIILKEIKELVQDLRNCSKRARELEWYMSGDTGANSYLSRLKELGFLKEEKKEETYNTDELRHLAGNYAITCLKGYDGSFEDWLKNIDPKWRKIANRKK
ncbi:MAG: hypothetical protein AABY15_02540 [Nanoarchaeota archaeon]